MPVCIKKLRLNKFRQVSCPSNQDLFYRIGPRPLPGYKDGQVAETFNGGLEAIDAMEAILLKESQMPLNEDK